MIHPTAIVADGAELDSSVSVGPFTVIEDGVKVAEGTKIGPHVVIKGPTTIGSDNRIFQFSSIGEDPQDKKYAGELTRLTIGNGNTIREYCTINRGTAQDRAETTLGDDNWLMAYVHIAHDCVVGDHTIMANGATLAGHVHVGDWAILGGYTGVHQFCRIGAHAFVGMYSILSKDVPAYVMTMGQPTSPRGINAEGLKRRGFSDAQVRNIKNAYRVLYRQGLKLDEARQELEARAQDQPELNLLLQSIGDSQRSILR